MVANRGKFVVSLSFDNNEIIKFMRKIKFNKSVSYVFLTKDNMYISSDKISAQISYEKQNVLNITEKVMAVLLRKKAEDLGVDTSRIVVVLSEDYYLNKHTIKTFVKNENKEKRKPLRLKNVFSAGSDKERSVSEYSEFVYQGQYINDYSALPLLQNYFECTNVLEKRSDKYDNLISELESNDIFPMAVIPFTEFSAAWIDSHKEHQNSEQKYVINISQSTTTISVYNGVYLRKSKTISSGLDMIIEKISNRFNISFAKSRVLIEKYGFVFLPAKYVNFVIEIPVYDDIVISVELPDLSYVLRESMRDLFADLFQQIGNDLPESVGVFSSIEIPGITQLAHLLLNAEPVNLSFANLDFENTSRIVNVLLDEEIKSKEIVPVKTEPEPIQVEEEINMGFKEKITDLINSRIKPFLLEPEI